LLPWLHQLQVNHSKKIDEVKQKGKHSTSSLSRMLMNYYNKEKIKKKLHTNQAFLVSPDLINKLLK
jgi:hypothetical protein